MCVCVSLSLSLISFVACTYLKLARAQSEKEYYKCTEIGNTICIDMYMYICTHMHTRTHTHTHTHYCR